MSDLTVEILREIRDEIRKTNERLDKTNDRLDETRTDLSARLDETRTELSARIGAVERRQAEMEMRLATELVAVAGAVRELRDVLVEDRKLREKVENHETRLTALELRPVRGPSRGRR